jgi:hypothetical protein
MPDIHDQPDSDDPGSDDQLIQNLFHQDPQLAQALLQPHNGSIQLLLHEFIHSIDINAIIQYLSSSDFRSTLLKAVMKRKWYIIFGIFLLCNPLAMAGFGVLGPTAGVYFGVYEDGLINERRNFRGVLAIDDR